MLNELKIHCFFILAETLSFTETGRRLYISQQAVSRHIMDMENDIGVKLFERSRNHVRLTENGEKVKVFLQDTTCRYDALLEEIRESSPENLHAINIGYQNWLSFGLTVSHAIAAMHETVQDLRLEGQSHSPAQLQSMLSSGSLDIILILGRFMKKHSGTKKLLLTEALMQLVVSRNDVLCSREGDYRRFSERALLIDALEGESRSDTVARAKKELRPYDFSPSEIIVVPNRDSVYTEAELGRGVFLSSEMMQPVNADVFERFDTGVTDGLYCVWTGDSVVLSSFAKQLKKAYQEKS